MPVLCEYVCEYGHRFEHMHMGKRDEIPDYLPCEGMTESTSYQRHEALEGVKYDTFTQMGPPALKRCSRMAERAVSAVRAKTIVRGNGDFLEREKERLTKRSQEYDKSNAGKQAKMEAAERRLKNGGLL